MKHRFGNMVVLLALILVISAAGVSRVRADATLVARWTLDNTYNDSVGSANGTAYNSPVFRFYYKVDGSHSLELNGSNQYVALPYTLSGEYTISLWIKPDAVASRNILVYTTSAGPTTNWSSQIRITADGKAQHYLWDGATKSVTGNTVLRVGTWNFLTITAKNNGQMKLYVNGYPEGAPVSIGTYTGSGDRFRLGSNSGDSMGYYDGIVDDIRIYNAQMSDTEVQALYSSYGSDITYYVKSGAMGDCSSWERACMLLVALANSLPGDQIWVAAGGYIPTLSPTDRTATFQLKNGVAVYGGFPASGNPVFDNRNPAVNVTILSGDIDINDVNTDGNLIAETSADIVGNNSYHVVTGATGATLDGFTVTAGYASAAFPNERGGGMYNGNSSPTVANVTFRGNFASTSGEWRTTKAARRSRTSPSAATAPTGGVGWITTGAAIHRLRRSPSPATRQPMMAAG